MVDNIDKISYPWSQAYFHQWISPSFSLSTKLGRCSSSTSHELVQNHGDKLQVYLTNNATRTNHSIIDWLIKSRRFEAHPILLLGSFFAVVRKKGHLLHQISILLIVLPEITSQTKVCTKIKCHAHRPIRPVSRWKLHRLGFKRGADRRHQISCRCAPSLQRGLGKGEWLVVRKMLDESIGTTGEGLLL